MSLESSRPIMHTSIAITIVAPALLIVICATLFVTFPACAGFLDRTSAHGSHLPCKGVLVWL